MLGISDFGTALELRGTGRITSTAKSYVFVPAIQAVYHFSTDQTRFTRQDHGQGYLKIIGGTGGTAELVFPVTLASVQFGQVATVERVSLSFDASDTSVTINRIEVYRSTMSGSYTPLMINDDNDGNGWTTENDWYVIELFPTSNNTCASHIGYLTVRVYCDIPAGENIFFSGVRIELAHE